MFKLAALSLFSSALCSHAALRGAPSSSLSHSTTSDETHRNLAAVSFTGECTVANFAGAVGGASTLATYLGTSNNAVTMQGILDSKCAEALKPTM